VMGGRQAAGNRRVMKFWGPGPASHERATTSWTAWIVFGECQSLSLARIRNRKLCFCVPTIQLLSRHKSALENLELPQCSLGKSIPMSGPTGAMEPF